MADTDITERLINFPHKPAPTGDDIVYLGDMADSGEEKYSTADELVTGSTIPLKKANNLDDLADLATALANLQLVIGTNVQAYSARLASLAALTSQQITDLINLITLTVTEGANARMGASVLSSGTVTISTNLVAANSRIFVTGQNAGSNDGFLTITNRVNGTSFDIVSSNALDDRDVAWILFTPS